MNRRRPTDAEYAIAYQRSGGYCTYCGCELTPNYDEYDEDDHNIEIDHIVPVCRNGADDISNMQAICWQCNAQKSDKTDAEFRYLIATVPQFLNCIYDQEDDWD